MAAELSFAHRFIPGNAEQGAVLVLHGTGGDENSLLQFGRSTAPGRPLLSPRGKVLERGQPRFFRRHSEGVFDLDDLRRQAQDLARFVRAAAAAYSFDLSRLVSLGYSNGANMSLALLLLEPGILSGAAALRPMVPFVPANPPALQGARLLISAGMHDPLVAREESQRLAGLFREYGAGVELVWQEAGHELTAADLSAAKTWMEFTPHP